VPRPSGKNKTEVRAKLAELHDELDDRVVTNASYAVARAIEDWLADGLAGRAPKTISTQREILEPLIDIIGAVPLRELSAPTVRSALKDLAATRATRTVSMTHAGLMRAIRHAEANDKVRRNVATLVDTPAATEQRCHYGGDEYGGSDESEHGNDAGHEPGPVQQGAQQQCVDARHEALREQERPVVDRDVRSAGGDKRGRIARPEGPRPGEEDGGLFVRAIRWCDGRGACGLTRQRRGLISVAERNCRRRWSGSPGASGSSSRTCSAPLTAPMKVPTSAAALTCSSSPGNACCRCLAISR
jgi:hypothetical protein